MPAQNTLAALRVAMASYYLPSNSKMGVGYQAHALANALVARGHEVTVFSSSEPAAGAEYQTVTVPVRGNLRTVKFALAMRKRDWSSYDVLHAHAGDYLVKRGRVGAHIRTVHGSSLSEARHIQGTRQRLAMLFYWLCEMVATVVADEAVAVSRNTSRWRPWIRTVIPNGVDLTRFRPGVRSENPSVLFVGTYGLRKRGKLLTEVFEREVLPRFPEAELWMVSEDALARPAVKALGRVSDTELASLYRRAWVFCLPSTYEGFGIPYIEAMASGCPVVATPNPGAVEVTERGRFGVLVEDGALGHALVKLLGAADERDRLSRAARSHARKFDLLSVAAEYEALYRSVLSRRR